MRAKPPVRVESERSKAKKEYRQFVEEEKGPDGGAMLKSLLIEDAE